MKVLVLADLHLGKYPPDLADVLTIDLELGVLRHAVEIGLREGVEGVILLGDVLDRWQYRTSFSVLEEMRKMFLRAGLPAVLIRGNHEPLPGDPVYRAYSNDMFWFVTSGDGQFAVRLSEIKAPGAVGEFLRRLDGVVAVPYPVDSFPGPREATDLIRQVLRPGDVVFAHYFVEGYAPPAEDRFVFPINGHLLIVGHYHVASYAPDKGVVVVGALLPRDHFFADSYAHFGIYDLATGAYEPYTLSLPYAFVRKISADADGFIERVGRFFEENPQVKKLKVWSLYVPTPDDASRIQVALAEIGLDKRVVIRQIVPLSVDGGSDIGGDVSQPVFTGGGDVLSEFKSYLEMIRAGSVEMDRFNLDDGDVPMLVDELRRILDQMSGGGGD